SSVLAGKGVLEAGKGVEGGRCLFRLPPAAVVDEILELGVLLVVAVEAQEFPVAAVRGVVVVVVVDVVDGQFPQVGAGELPGAAGADPGVELQGLLPVALLPLFDVVALFRQYPVEAAGGGLVIGHGWSRRRVWGQYTANPPRTGTGSGVSAIPHQGQGGGLDHPAHQVGDA